MAAEMNTLRVLLPTYAIAAFWGFIVLLKLLWKIIWVGPRKVLSCQPRDTRPPLVDDPSLGSHHFARLKNLKLHFVTQGPEGAPLMLFLHGFPEFWYSWRHQLKAFSHKYRCVALDMRGYNESDKPYGVRNYTMELLIQDVKELIEALDYKKAVIVGHDQGGAVAWKFTWTHPDLVERLIVLNCPNRAFAPFIAKSRAQFLRSWYMFLFQLPYLPELFLYANDMEMLEQWYTSNNMGFKSRPLSPEEIEAYKYSLGGGEGGISPALNHFRAAFRYKHVPFPTERLSVRTLIIWATNDGAYEKDLARLSANYCDECTVKYIEGGSHWVQQDEPELTNQHIREFLES